jgi:hypothetical protein
MLIYGGCFIDRHILGNVIRGTTMSKLVVLAIILSQEKVAYEKEWGGVECNQKQRA